MPTRGDSYFMSDSNLAQRWAWTAPGCYHPDLARNVGKLLQAYRDAPPEQREKALLAAMREIKQAAASTAVAASAKVEPDTEAESLYRRIIMIHERKAPGENLDLADTAEEYAALLRRMKRNDEADRWHAACPGNP